MGGTAGNCLRVRRNGPAGRAVAHAVVSPALLPFSRPELDLLNILVPHLQRAIQMRQRFTDIEIGQNFLAKSLDALAISTLLFDEYCRVVYMNRSCAALL